MNGLFERLVTGTRKRRLSRREPEKHSRDRKNAHDVDDHAGVVQQRYQPYAEMVDQTVHHQGEREHQKHVARRWGDTQKWQYELSSAEVDAGERRNQANDV